MSAAVDTPYGAVEDGVIAARDGRIVYAGPRHEAPVFDAAVSIDCAGRWITPGLIDCHTHLVYGGDRAHEFELRLQGATYKEIARAGGGILSTVKATREASEDTLFASVDKRLAALMAEGVTTVEIKSGYGLEQQAELKQLRVARRIGRERPVTVRTTFLGAHAVPPEYKGRSGDYTALVAGPLLDAVAAEGLADAVDVFCEGIAFSPDETKAVFEAAKAKGLAIKIHAEQLSNLHGAKLAAEMGALSADHLEYLDEDGVIAMAKAGTVAVVLPGAFYFLRETQKPPIELMRKHGAAIALATDANPGSSPLTSPLLVLNMACTLFRMTPEEALAGLTRHAAKALDLQDEVGTLEAGKRCDLAIWEIERPAELAYRIGFNPLHTRIWNGQ
ncbi:MULTISPECIES: imidazolonepropionase [Bosea]|uniref:imidazolonepropionase n=1 Tax=Bosea TaxID=85413 RepID=UPI00286AAE70|nr:MULTISPECIES: imidazolonepropionase [Bosea]